VVCGRACGGVSETREGSTSSVVEQRIRRKLSHVVGESGNLIAIVVYLISGALLIVLFKFFTAFS